MASCPSIYAWADNIQHMDPCKVASSLRDMCDGSLPPLQPITNHKDTYPGPSTKLQSESPCLCSSVIYALLSACSDCQGGRIESWSTWSTKCAKPLVDSFEKPLPANISVPSWAYFDVKSHPIYSPSSASSSAVALQATSTSSIASATALEVAAAVPTSTHTSTLTKSGFTSLETANFGSDMSSATKGNRTAAIAGGTIAAVLLLATGTALAYWYIRRRRRKKVPPSAAYMALHGSVY